MTQSLNPKIAEKLAAFAQRRRKLIIVRGIAGGLAMLIATMLVVALIDWLFVLPDAARWTLSGLAYLAVIVTEWRSCLRLLANAPDPRRLARLVEHAEPKLREDLLSAVELGSGVDERVLDSAQFRALVQNDVAARVEGLKVESLLPVKLVRSYLNVAAAILVAAVLAFFLAGAQLGTLLVRALLPMANLARVSRVHVEIVSPNPADRVVAQGDAEPLVVQLSGHRASKAFLETFTPSGGRELVQMTPAGDDRFTGAIQVAREDVQYRVRAGDAITRKYSLRSVARPAVVNFEKTFTFPEYLRTAPKHVVEENGDLIAIEGSEVELRLATNQKIADGELDIEQGKKSYTVKLTSDGDKLLAKVPLSASGIYRVHLVGADSGFDNKFSPEYELRAEPDLVPLVEIELPKQDLILPANEIVDVRGSATDDQALAKVSQLVKVNDGAWKETTLAKEPGKTAKVERRWDLFEQGVKPGDLVTTKLVATDLKGNRAESRSVQVTITASGFESKRLSVLDAERALYETLQALRAESEALEKTARDFRDRFQKIADGDPQRKQVAIDATSKLETFQHRAEAAWSQLFATLKIAPAGHESGDLLMLARLLAKMQQGAAQFAHSSLDVLAGDPATPPARDVMNETAEQLVQAGQQARIAEEMFKQLLACDELDVLAENMNVVSAEQARIGELARASGDDAAKWTQIANRLRVVLSETKSLEDMMLPLAERPTSGGSMRGHLSLMKKKIEQPRSLIQKALAGGAAGPGLLDPVQKFTAALDDSARSLMDLRRGIAAIPQHTFRQLAAQAGPIHAPIEALAGDTERVARNSRLAPDAKAALLTARWDSRAATLKAIGDAEETRVSADTYFVNDLRSTTLVLQTMQPEAVAPGGEKLTPRLVALDKSFRVLETGHSISEIVDALRVLSGSEHWEIVAARARTSNPHDWAWIDVRLRMLPEELARNHGDPELRPVIAAVQRIVQETVQSSAFRSVDREMGERFRIERRPARTAADVEAVEAMLRKALDLLRKPMDDARAMLAAMMPKLNEMMAQLANQAEQLKQESAHQSEAAEGKPRDEAQADAKRELAKQEKLNEKIDTLRDALRADANKQDILSADGRERARDADDALAMLSDPPAKAADALAEAARSEAPQVQKQALRDAAEEQKKLADSLNQLAQHYDNMEKGKPEESRTALRAAEQEKGMKEQLDQQYAKAEELEKMAEKSPQELLAELEKALPKNPVMQQELSAISKNTLTEAQQKLQSASAVESSVANSLQRMAAEQATAAQPGAADPAKPQQSEARPAPSKPGEAAQKNPQPAQPPPATRLADAAAAQTPVAQGAMEAGADVERAGRHEERLKNAAGQQLQQLGQEIAAIAQTEVPAAQQALAEAKMAADAQAAVAKADAALKRELGQLSATGNQDGQMNGAQSPVPSQPPTSANPQSASPQSPAGSATPGAPQSPQAARPEPTVRTFQDIVPGVPALPTDLAKMEFASPQEQVWMARTLDALDEALNAPASESGNPGEKSAQTQPGQQPGQQQSQQPGQQNAQQQSDSTASQAMKQAQNAMTAAAKAAASEMRATRSQTQADQPGDNVAQGDDQPASKGGAKVDGTNSPYGTVPEARGLKAGDWGKLPKKIAEQMTQGQHESVAGEYRSQVETYYRVVAEKAKKQ